MRMGRFHPLVLQLHLLEHLPPPRQNFVAPPPPATCHECGAPAPADPSLWRPACQTPASADPSLWRPGWESEASDGLFGTLFSFIRPQVWHPHWTCPQCIIPYIEAAARARETVHAEDDDEPEPRICWHCRLRSWLRSTPRYWWMILCHPQYWWRNIRWQILGHQPETHLFGGALLATDDFTDTGDDEGLRL
jgi:hypothetical protein